MPFARLSTSTAGWLLVILLVITFSLGALLATTIRERNTIEQTLEETKQDLKEEQQEHEVEKKNTAGCMAQVSQLNQGIADQALTQLGKDKAANDLVNVTLGQLPVLIQTDQAANASPAIATNWVKGLFQ